MWKPVKQTSLILIYLPECTTNKTDFLKAMYDFNMSLFSFSCTKYLLKLNFCQVNFKFNESSKKSL